jgi:hypothetical protein
LLVVSGLTEPGKSVLGATLVRFRVQVCHCIHDSDDVVAVMVGAARPGFHACRGRNDDQEDLGYAAFAQDFVDRCADKCAPTLLADQIITGLLL